MLKSMILMHMCPTTPELLGGACVSNTLHQMILFDHGVNPSKKQPYSKTQIPPTIPCSDIYIYINGWHAIPCILLFIVCVGCYTLYL